MTAATAATTFTSAVAFAAHPAPIAAGAVPPGMYHITKAPANLIGSTLDNCDLQVFPDGNTVLLLCPSSSRTGLQNVGAPGETYISFDGQPTGMNLRADDPNRAHWSGTVQLTGTPLAAPEPVAGIVLNRR
ncbi:MAG: hypothetical protein J2P18_12775 [Nocardia sp.]|nr:hypothetical protein [Nocardia sp.]